MIYMHTIHFNHILLILGRHFSLNKVEGRFSLVSSCNVHIKGVTKMPPPLTTRSESLRLLIEEHIPNIGILLDFFVGFLQF